ncbi:MAG: type II secretion system secretin GspD [Pseudomonadota bacterium]|nr:type II secretion system secretin GspD [Pseudomonadota bacterium]
MTRACIRWFICSVAIGLSLGNAVHATEPVTLNLQDADLEAVIQTVGRITGKNFVIDPRVKGKATVVSSRPMSPDEVYQVFLSVLEVHGYAAVEEGNTVKIVPDVNARQSATPVVFGQQAAPARYSLVTRVIALRNVPAAQLVPVLRPLVPQNGHVAAYPETNVLIISDAASNVERLVNIVRSVDQPTHNQAEVIQLEEASAVDLVRVLKSLSGDAQGGPSLVADERTNSIILGGDPAARLRLRALIRHLDAPVSDTGGTHVAYLRFAKAEELAPIIETVLTREKKPNAGTTQTSEGVARVQAYEATNALVISASPDQLTMAKRIVRELDIRRPQVLVEAIIAEVGADTSKELGFQWLVNDVTDNFGTISLTNFTNAGMSLAQLGAAVVAEEIPPVGRGLSLALGDFGGDNDWGVLVQALAADTDTNVLSMPSLLTLDNEEAEIIVGQNVPFITGQFTNTGAVEGASNPFQTIQREDIGLTLRITPQINEDATVQLDVEQEVSSIAPDSGRAADLITTKRSIKTSVLVDTGATIVLGGLIDDKLNKREQRVPVLGDVPVLGALFRFRDAQVIKRNLMVFLRPSILRIQDDNTVVTRSKYQQIREKQLKAIETDRRLRDTGKPLLPSLEQWEQQNPVPPQTPSPKGIDDSFLRHEPAGHLRREVATG